MPIQLAPLPSAFDSFMPYLSEATLRAHYEKHHAAYVEHTNQFIEGTRFQNLPIEEIIFETAQSEGLEKKIFQNAAQVWNHTLLPTLPTREFAKAILKTFNGISEFQKHFNQTTVATLITALGAVIED